MNKQELITKSYLRKNFPHRAADSHKGDNGRVMIVGGSKEYYGAPLLSALGAIYGGADLVYLFVPSYNFEVTRSLYPDFIVRRFEGEYLKPEHVKDITEFAGQCDVLLIGPGIGERAESLKAIRDIIEKVDIPMVLDAAAILAIAKIEIRVNSSPIVLTPHRHEFELFSGKSLRPFENIEHAAALRGLAMDKNVHILLKGPVDTVVSPKADMSFNETGNAGMSVGGSGDILSGAISALIAQNCNPYYACQLAAFALGATGDTLARQKGYFFSATDLALELPFTLNSIIR